MSVPTAWQQVRDGRKAGWPELGGLLRVRIPPWRLLSHQTSAFAPGAGEVGEAGEGQGSVAAGCVALLSSGAKEASAALLCKSMLPREVISSAFLTQDQAAGCAFEQFWCSELQFSSFLGQRILTLSFIPPQ